MSGKHRFSTVGKLVVGAFATVAVGAGGIYYAFSGDEPHAERVTIAGEVVKVEPEVKPQTTSMWHVQKNGREYVLWDGLVVEEITNQTGYNTSDVSFDKNIYDFDLGVIIHATHSSVGGMQKTLFNDLAVNGKLPQHIEDVKKAGCEVVEAYERGHKRGEYGPPPADVLSYKQKFCGPAVN